jgi:molecular chaperone GrpE
MEDPFEIVESPKPIPEAALKADPIEEYKKLLIRNSQLVIQLERQKTDGYKSLREFLMGLLEIADALERILHGQSLGRPTPPESNERLKKSIEITLKLLLQKLIKAGVVPLDLIGKPLDPTLADIEDYERKEELPDETVIHEIIKGYIWNQEVLRRAKVVVSHRSE